MVALAAAVALTTRRQASRSAAGTRMIRSAMLRHLVVVRFCSLACTKKERLCYAFGIAPHIAPLSPGAPLLRGWFLLCVGLSGRLSGAVRLSGSCPGANEQDALGTMAKDLSDRVKGLFSGERAPVESAPGHSLDA